MDKREPNLVQVFKNFPDHLFSKTNTKKWKPINSKKFINEGENQISELLKQIKTSDIDKQKENKFKRISVKPIKQLSSKNKASKRSSAYYFESAAASQKTLKIEMSMTPKKNSELNNKSKLVENISCSFLKIESQKERERERERINSSNYMLNGSMLNIIPESNNSKQSSVVPKLRLSESICKSARASAVGNTKPINLYKQRTPFTDRSQNSRCSSASPKTFREIKRQYRDQLQVINDSVPSEYNGTLNTPLFLTPCMSAQNKHRTKYKIELSEHNDKGLFITKLKKGLPASDVNIKTERVKGENIIKNPLYNLSELKEMKDEFKAKGVFIKEKKKTKYYSMEDNGGFFKRDYYINTITENAALTYKKLLIKEFLANKNRKYSIDKNEKLINSNTTLGLFDKSVQIRNLENSVEGRFEKMFKKQDGLSVFKVKKVLKKKKKNINK
jgi:hypothetical protein